MKKTILLFFLLLILVSSTRSQHYYRDASQFLLLGKASEATETLYERLPAKLESISRVPVWRLGKNTAGLAVRFSSNTSSIAAKWELRDNNIMNHMTPTGIKGLDLYCLEDSGWTFVNAALPTPNGKMNDKVIIDNMSKKEREFLLYLPLYDGLISLEIGVDSSAYIAMPQIDSPITKLPVVAYGTSILQGGCASRPGMVHTSILSRWLNREFINLGFSGNGQLDYEIAEVMGDCEASVYILDFMPNVTVEQIEEKMAKFYSILRQKAPHTPIIFIENPDFPLSTYNERSRDIVLEKNQTLHREYEKLARRDKNISIISSYNMIGLDKEGTIDGIHFTDLGFMRYAEFLYPTLKKILSDK